LLASLSGRGLRASLWQHPFPAADPHPALFLQRLQRIGDTSLFDLSAPRIDMFRNLGGRERAVLIQDFGDGLMEQGGPNFRFYKMLFHELHKAYEAGKKLGEELLDEGEE
jgi:hypothetical protein